MTDFAAERVIIRALNEGYGDRQTSPLDRVVANRIVAELRNLGWVTSLELAFVVQAAGGQIRIPQQLLEEIGNDIEITQYRDDMTNEIVLKTRRS